MSLITELKVPFEHLTTLSVSLIYTHESILEIFLFLPSGNGINPLNPFAKGGC